MRKTSRTAFDRAKRRAGTRRPRDIPGFLESLQSLYNQGYRYADIGPMFGVSPQRARQWFVEYPELHAEHDESRTSPRFFCWESLRFVPASEGDIVAKARALRDKRRAARRALSDADVEELQKERAEGATYRDLARGRDVCVSTVWSALSRGD